VRVTQLEGGASEAELIREQMAAKAREERIELLQRQIGRRMMNRGLSEAWTAWFEMWSAKTYAMQRLREVGVTDAELDRLMSPIGLDLGARTPEETAISICAEIIARRTGRAAPSLRDADGPIHS
jgi:hypothetical protein